MTKYVLNGKTVTRKEFLRGAPGLRAGEPCFVASTRGWPLVSEAMGVHPSQVQAVMADDRRKGVPTDYTRDGCPIFTSRAHRKRYCEAHGYFDRNGGYGDPQKRR